MTDTTTANSEQSIAPATSATSEVTLDEFCLRLSQKDKRVELIGGFYATEKRAGHFKGAESDFTARFQKFVNKPV